MPAVSLIATLVATLSSFVLGAIWYGPLFGTAWMFENGFTRERLTEKFNPGIAYGTTFILAFVASYVFGLSVGPGHGVPFCAAAGASVGIFWVATSLATNYIFERRSIRLLLINGGYHAVRFTLIGVVFGLLG